MANISYTPTGSGDATALNTLMAANTGSSISLQAGTYDIDTTVNLLASTPMIGVNKSSVLFIAASGFGDASMVYSNNTDTCTIKNVTIDGNGEDDTQGLNFRQSDGHVIDNIIIKDTG